MRVVKIGVHEIHDLTCLATKHVPSIPSIFHACRGRSEGARKFFRTSVGRKTLGKR